MGFFLAKYDLWIYPITKSQKYVGHHFLNFRVTGSGHAKSCRNNISDAKEMLRTYPTFTLIVHIIRKKTWKYILKRSLPSLFHPCINPPNLPLVQQLHHHLSQFSLPRLSNLHRQRICTGFSFLIPGENCS